MSTITFVGDVFIEEDCLLSLSYENLVMNFEAPITELEAGIPGKINLKTNVTNVEQCEGFSPVAVCLANNHIYDFKEQGFIETLEYFDEKGIAYFGAGQDQQVALSPLLLDIGGQIVALIGAACPSTSPVVATESTAGAALIDEYLIGKAIQKAKNQGAKVVVVNYHWGAEEVGAAKPEDITLGRKTIDMGADIVIGHHAHCIQPYEEYKGKMIFYGLGNCLFPDFEAKAKYSDKERRFTSSFKKRQEYWNNQSIAVTYDVNTRGVSVDILENRHGNTMVRHKHVNMFRKTINNNDIYKKYFKFIYLYSKIRSICFRFIREPKLPAKRHLLGIFSLIKSNNYK